MKTESKYKVNFQFDVMKGNNIKHKTGQNDITSNKDEKYLINSTELKTALMQEMRYRFGTILSLDIISVTPTT